VSCGDVVVKKGDHPPLKIVISHNDKRGAFPPEVARPMFNAMGLSPGIQLYLIFLEALRMQHFGFNVGVEVVILNTPDPDRWIPFQFWGNDVVVASWVFKRQSSDAGRFG
jgi:hypothetical protein